MNCTNCGRQIPADSALCPYCGTRIAAAEAQHGPATGATERLEPVAERPRPDERFEDDTLSRDGELSPPPAASAAPAGAPAAERAQVARKAVPIGAIWLIGMGILFLTGTIWPGVLVLVGLSAYVGAYNSGNPNVALSSLVFFVGLALLFYFNWLWPGILILLGVEALLNAGTLRGRGR